ncbi:1-aminocyclopropane-1-carboxylate deaminase/D-cysteine desulfhydrase [Pseudomonas turukhanskensis]|uniref:1-aminocyclopropane-1-carboxylate deaminase n=1 Tax=Pseudomonas turukhanskensis TaxID=1806536 RepID=A0A9W6NEE4_9PSED|nr:pyridoxal-phosphate dependent enzyme [Pseudomonas turukhanskensis]GLK88599.1 1-aminocyclopropane-1-carboxylate deaminase [Pseudomonas turukhanskensis]
MPVTLPHWTPQAPLQRLRFPWLTEAGVELAVLRLDQIDPLISGNKWFKLRHHLEAAQIQASEGVISLGGAHSNHLHALAAAGQRFGFATVGLLRGQAHDTPTTRDLEAWGMRLHWLGYGGYRLRHQADFWQPWLARYPGFYPVPEGGGGLSGALGCVELRAMAEAQLPSIGWDDFDAWWLAVGTGTTLAGLVLAEAGRRQVFGACAVPPDHGVEQNLQQLFSQAGQTDQGYQLLEASRGGFAKVDTTLTAFVGQAEQDGELPLEAIYTGKALMALRLYVAAGNVARGTRLLFVHTGGLQGRRATHPHLAGV